MIPFSFGRILNNYLCTTAKDKNRWVDYEIFFKTTREYTETIAEVKRDIYKMKSSHVTNETYSLYDFICMWKVNNASRF